MKKLFLGILVLSLAGCTTAQQAKFQSDLTAVNTFANKYGPIVGKDLLMIANILVQAECSPGLAAGSQVAANILKIVAPNSSSVTTVSNVLNTNIQVANQLCPYVASIKATVGNVPNGTPSQVIPASP